MNKTNTRWKNETKQQHKSAKQSLIALQEQNQAEHDALEEKWVQPSTIRKFDKRSPNLLQNRQREQYMLLTGRYEEAEQMKQLNVVTEKIELEERKTEMNIHFLMARSELIQKQQSITQKKQEEIAQAENILAEKERKDLEIKNKRLLATQRTLEEEKDYNKFINKKFKRPATCIVPSTVMASRDATEDIPPIPHGAVIPHSVSDMMNIRKRSIVTPLPLQPLSIRKYKAPRLVRNSK
ncbi:hypothetical protein TRFO_12063 [Tritrichomonas foetus]|uniref:Uncharacterized protein n=1 Tax=Tritrichomonas foetus TaxID=1144522 RepID=A0A1J4J6I9_9EUKA|nr:hypothetical protein TRFO_12063 [Tritrichomonas foetus]|eukprot:OHS93053.1 hypothetical protein TRFO_12063 [Tritrichomonas foetus]